MEYRGNKQNLPSKVYCLLPSAFCLLPSAFCLLPSALKQFSPHHCDRLAAEFYPVAFDANLHHSAARRGLVGHKLGFAQPLRPVRPQDAVGRARHRVFVDPAPGAKKRETKSNSPPSPRAVTMTPRALVRPNRAKFGSRLRTARSESASTR